MSKAITLTLPHELGRAEARRRIDKSFEDFARHLGGAAGPLNRTWDGDRLRFALEMLGQRISGVIDVEDTALKMEIVLPNVLALMAGKLRGRLQSEGRLLLEKKP
jgi:hypothetical protein